MLLQLRLGFKYRSGDNGRLPQKATGALRSLVKWSFDIWPTGPGSQGVVQKVGQTTEDVLRTMPLSRRFISGLNRPHRNDYASLMGGVFLYLPRVKSGKSMGVLFTATERSLSGEMTDHVTAS